MEKIFIVLPIIIIPVGGCWMFIPGSDFTTIAKAYEVESTQSIHDRILNTYDIDMPMYDDQLNAWFFSNCVEKEAEKAWDSPDPPTA